MFLAGIEWNSCYSFSFVSHKTQNMRHNVFCVD